MATETTTPVAGAVGTPAHERITVEPTRSTVSASWLAFRALILRDLIRQLAMRGKVVLFSSHELETVERVCSRVIILHKVRLVANDSIAQLRALMSLPTLEGIFSQLAIEQDTEAITRDIVQVMER